MFKTKCVFQQKNMKHENNDKLYLFKKSLNFCGTMPTFSDIFGVFRTPIEVFFK